MKKIYSLFIFFLLPVFVFAQWSPDSTINTPVCVQPAYQGQISTIPDGNGGAFLCWMDDRTGQDQNIYAQHMSAAGFPLWPVNGVPVCTSAGVKDHDVIASDGQGGIVVAWTDWRVGREVYAQRINSLGNPVWQTDGIQLSDNGWWPKIISTTGAVIVAWTKEFSSGDSIYVQKIKIAGQIQWGAGGKSANITGGLANMSMVPDEAEGAVIATTFQWVYAQRINTNGIPLWGVGGKIVCNVSSAFEPYQVLAATHDGHFIIAWQDHRFDVPPAVIYSIYAQRLDLDGNISWPAEGLLLTPGDRQQLETDIVSDGNGGAIIAFRDFNNQADSKIFGQRVSANGSLLWGTYGNQLSSTNQPFGAEMQPSMAGDGNGGAYVTWARIENFGTLYYTIMAQHISATGQKLWPSNSVIVSNPAFGTKEYHQKAVPDANCGIIVFWEDLRNGTSNADIYGTHVDCNSAVVVPVKLISFTGKQEGAKNLLEWVTAHEQNSLSFTVEKSKDASSFHGYKSINAAGTSTTEKHYNMYDDDPYNGTTYYRLRQTDIDGVSTYSQVIALHNKQSLIQPVYPNPGNGIFTVELNQPGNTVLEIYVMNAAGEKIYYSGKEHVGSGFKQKIDISNQAKGTSFVKIKTTETSVVEKLVIF